MLTQSGLNKKQCHDLLARLQVKYVVELARAIATHPAVHRVDLLTRLVKDSKVGRAAE